MGKYDAKYGAKHDAKKNSVKTWVPFWTIPCVILLSVGTVWLRLKVVQTTYELNQANKILQTLKLEKERTDLKLAQLRSPRRLEKLARQSFHLEPPTADRVISMKR